MITHKCDNCKKAIKDDNLVRVYAFKEKLSAFELCANCSKPILQTLKKYKLVKVKNS